MSTPSPRMPLPAIVTSKAALRIGEYEVIYRENGELTIEHWQDQYTGIPAPVRLTAEQLVEIAAWLAHVTD